MRQKSIDEMLAKIEQAIGSSAFLKMSASANELPHPSSEQLYHYARSELECESAAQVRRGCENIQLCAD